MVLRLVSGVGPGGTSTKDALIGIFMSINHRFVVVGRYRDIGTQLDGPPLSEITPLMGGTDY